MVRRGVERCDEQGLANIQFDAAAAECPAAHLARARQTT
jgi:hypothetical protein